MIRKTGLLLVCALAFTSAFPASITIDVPDELSDLSNPICEQLRQTMFYSPDVWTTKLCAEEFLRQGFRNFRINVVQNEARDAAVADVQTAIAVFDGTFPATAPVAGRTDVPRVMQCGDGIVENDALGTGYVEECDDGNVEDGDGCSALCTNET